MIPVYEMLSESSMDIELSLEEKEMLTRNVKEMNQIGHELVYVIIKSYEKENSKDITAYPYEGKPLKTGVKFDIDNFDNRLKQIIFKFSKLHLETQRELR
jgi:hypothetical protein